MQPRFKGLVCSLLLAFASPASAGLTVSSYTTVAGTNAFAPVGGTEYITIETLANVTPAHAEVSADWMGPNAGGSTNTWHWVGTSQATSTTVSDASSYTVTAAGSFAYELNTTADFIDPRSSSIFSPGGGANYNGFFNTDVSTTYAITGQLNQWGRVRLNSLNGSVVFDQTNPTTISVPVSLSGTIPPGQYRVLITASLGAPNLPNGVNHYQASGSFDHIIFAVQVPEPHAFGAVILIIARTMCRRKRCDSAS